MKRAAEQDVLEQNLQWAIRIQRKLSKNRKFSKIHVILQGGVVTGLTVELTLKPGDDLGEL